MKSTICRLDSSASEKQIQVWIEKGEYISGPQLVDAGLAELVEV